MSGFLATHVRASAGKVAWPANPFQSTNLAPEKVSLRKAFRGVVQHAKAGEQPFTFRSLHPTIIARGYDTACYFFCARPLPDTDTSLYKPNSHSANGTPLAFLCAAFTTCS